jgi:hypothetical protein
LGRRPNPTAAPGADGRRDGRPSCGHLTAGAFVGHARPLDLRSARAWFPRDCRLASLRRSPARLLRLVGLEGIRRPEARRTIKSSRSSRSNCWTRACQEGRRHTDRSLRNANAHRFDPALEKEGRAVLRGRPLRGRHSKNTDLFGRPCGRPSHVTLPHRGLAGSGAGGSALVLALCPTWALTAGG